MVPHRSLRFDVETLEGRLMLSGDSPGVVASATAPVVARGTVRPYVELTLKGHFVVGAPTTVTFAGSHQATITVTPASVSKTTVVVAVPAFFDPKTGEPVASTASVSVYQEVGGRYKGVRVLKDLSIARLPLTGLAPGDVLGAVAAGASTVTGLTSSSIAAISQEPGLPTALRASASGVIVDLDEIGQLIPQAEQLLVSLASGAVGSVPLGTYRGKAATLDAHQLELLDRIVGGGVNAATGATSQGVALVSALEGLITKAVAAGPASVVDRAVGVVDVLSTALGTPVVPPGTALTGLALGSLSAVVAATAAEALVVEGALSPSSTLGPSDLALVDRVLDDPSLGKALNAITAGFVPTTPAGLALLQAAEVAEDLAARVDPNVPGSLGAQLEAYLKSVPLHGG